MTVFVKNEIELCCSENSSWNFKIELMRNFRLCLSALTDGSRFGSAATNCESNFPPFSTSTCCQMSMMSVNTSCLTSSLERDFVIRRSLTKSLIASVTLIFLHSAIKICLADCKSSMRYVSRMAEFRYVLTRLSNCVDKKHSSSSTMNDAITNELS